MTATVGAVTTEAEAPQSPRSAREGNRPRPQALWPDQAAAQRAWSVEAAVRAGAMPHELPVVANKVYNFVAAGEVPESPPA